MPRYTGRKGWVTPYKETWDLEQALRPIIASSLQKFLEVMDGPQSDWVGVPGSLVGAEGDWKGIVEQMYYAFSEPEPDIMDYAFEITMLPGESKNGLVTSTSKIDNQEEYEQFDLDSKIHYAKVSTGYELFGKHLRDLWW